MLNPTSLLSGSDAALVGDVGLGLRISSIILIASFASSCVDCGSIANNGFLSSLLILACLISFVSATVGFCPIISLKYIAGNGALIGLKNAGLLELSIPISCSVAVAVVAATLCGS